MGTTYIPGLPSMLSGGLWANVKDSRYGDKGNGQIVTDAVATAASAVVTSASGKFKSADTGNSCAIWDPVNRRIVANNCTLTYNSATQVTLSVNAAFSGTGLTLIWGSDDTTAIQAAHDAVQAAGGGVVVVPEGIYCCATNHNVSVNGSNQGYCVRIKSGVRWTGVGMGGSILCTLNDASNLLLAWGESDIGVEQLTLRASGTQGDPIKLLAVSRFSVDHCHAIDGAYGYQCIGCTDGDLMSLHADGQYNSPTYSGGYAISIADVASASLLGTARVRVRGATCKSTAFGAVRIVGDVASVTTYPVGVKVSDVDAYQCGQGAGSQYGAFFIFAVTEADLALCRAVQCSLGYDFQGAGIAGTASASQCRAKGCDNQGFRGYGFAGGQLVGCFALDNNALNAGGAGIALMDDGSARGSTGWRVMACRAGNTTAGGLQTFGYQCNATNSGSNLVIGNDWTTAAGGNSQYKASDTHANNIPS